MSRLLLKGEEGGEKWVRLKLLHVYVIIRPPKNDLQKAPYIKSTTNYFRPKSERDYRRPSSLQFQRFACPKALEYYIVVSKTEGLLLVFSIFAYLVAGLLVLAENGYTLPRH
jgi:hypothetical protein